MILLILAFVSIAILTAVCIGGFKRLSVENDWLDKPTDRGSHQQAVPHIGGVVMMLMLFTITILLAVYGYLTWNSAAIWLLIITLLGLVGFIDDIKDLSRRSRFAAQIIVAVAAVGYFGGINSMHLGIVKIELSLISYLIGFIWVLGFINMYNFMDGINGIAGFQALIAGLFFAVWLSHFQLTGESMLFLAVAAVACGFLYWNFSPAKVFMGDSGSTMLGGLFAVISLQLHNEFELSMIFPVLLFIWFLTDSIFTFMKRLIRGERVWQAHRQHIYQQMAPNPSDHTKVSGIISLITLIIALIVTVVVLKQTPI